MNVKSSQRFAALLGAFLLFAAGAWAQTQPPRDVTVLLKGEKIILGTDGKEAREPATQAKPGDVIEYTATYSNKGRSAVKNVVATLPIPQDTDYQGASAKPGNAQAATADGQYRAMPLKRKVKQADGKEVEQDIPLTEYRNLRWQVGELAAGKEFVASTRVRISTTPIAAAPPAAAPVKK